MAPFRPRSGFLSSFFALVGLHGLHVALGSFWLVVMIGQIFAYGCDARVRVNLLRLGLFWHLIDIVWIAHLQPRLSAGERSDERSGQGAGAALRTYAVGYAGRWR